MLSLNKTICAVLLFSPVGKGFGADGFVKVKESEAKICARIGVTVKVLPLIVMIVPISAPPVVLLITIPTLKPLGTLLNVKTIAPAFALVCKALASTIGAIGICFG